MQEHLLITLLIMVFRQLSWPSNEVFMQSIKYSFYELIFNNNVAASCPSYKNTKCIFCTSCLQLYELPPSTCGDSRAEIAYCFVLHIEIAQWLCGNMPAMHGQWRSSPIVSVRTNRVLNKH